jgi:pilus assembly protein Flp/PilA
MLYIAHFMNRLQRDQRGASAVEYAILVGILGLAIAGGVQAFGDGLSGVFNGLLAKVKLV